MIHKLMIFLFLVFTTSRTINAQSWTPSSPNIYFDGGNVGIGTGNPQYPLDVAGTIRVSHSFQSDQGADPLGSVHWRLTTGNTFRIGLGLTNSETGGNEGSDFSIWRYADNGSHIANAFFLKRSNGSIGIGTAFPRGIFDIGTNGDIYLSSSPNIGTSQSVYLPGHIYIAPYDGGTVSYLQARRKDNSGSTSLQFRTYDNGNLIDAMRIDSYGNVGIGTTCPQAKLAVNGLILSTKVKVAQSTWCDYVFEPNYPLRPLSELEQFIQQYRHLPEVPSASEVEKDGLDLGDNQATLLKKIEELTLYIIEQNKRMDKLEMSNEQLKHENNIIKSKLKLSIL